MGRTCFGVGFPGTSSLANIRCRFATFADREGEVGKGGKFEASKWEKAGWNGGFFPESGGFFPPFPLFSGFSPLFPLYFFNKEAIKIGKKTPKIFGEVKTKGGGTEPRPGGGPPPKTT